MKSADHSIIASTKLLPVDAYLISRDSIESDRVCCRSANGDCLEHSIPRALLGDLLKIFDGKPRAIQRTSGGLSLCEPHQIVIYDKSLLIDPTTELTPVVRIRVRFHELLRDSKGKVMGPEMVLQSKVTLSSDLRHPFKLDGYTGPALVDFGLGIVPIAIFHVDSRNTGESMAYFTEPTLLTELGKKRTGSMTLVSAYTIPVRVIRMPDGDNSIDMARAQENLIALTKASVKWIPDCLRLKAQIPLPTGKSLRYLQSCLKAMMDPHARKEIEPLVIQMEEEKGLLPFGFFEPN